MSTLSPVCNAYYGSRPLFRVLERFHSLASLLLASENGFLAENEVIFPRFPVVFELKALSGFHKGPEENNPSI